MVKMVCYTQTLNEKKGKKKMTKCVLTENIKHKMNIIKFAKCYDFFNGEIIKLVNKMDEVENADIRPELKNSCLANLNTDYVNAVMGVTSSLQIFGSKIGLDIKDQKQLFSFFEKYNPILLPSDDSKDVYKVLNEKYNKALNNNMEELKKENLSGQGLIKRRMTVICSTVEAVYGKEINKLNSDFKLDNYVLQAGCSLKNNTATKNPKTNVANKVSKRIKDLQNDGK